MNNSANDTASLLLFQNYPPTILEFAVACCILFMFIGIPGNICTIAALYRSKIHSATAIFIINLSVSDLMFCCFNIPLATSLYMHRKWIHGDALCLLYPFFRYGLVAVSIFTVLAITINRYIMIAHPRWYRTMYKRSSLAMMVVSTWLSAFVFLLPTLLEKWGKFGLDLEIGSCSILPVNGQSPKEFLFVVAFALPCCVIIVCYARIFFIARKAEKKVSRGAKKGPKVVPGAVPSNSTTTTTTGPTSSSGASSASVGPLSKKSRRPKIGILVRNKGAFKFGPEVSVQNGFSQPDVELDGSTQNYVVKVIGENLEEDQIDGDQATAGLPAIPPAIEENSTPPSPAIDGGTETEVGREPPLENGTPSPKQLSPPLSCIRSSRKLSTGILISSEDDKPECDRIATFAADVLEATHPGADVSHHPDGGDQMGNLQEITETEDTDNPGNPPLVSCLGVKRGAAGAGQSGMSVNFAITSIRRTASKYKRGSFKTGLSTKDIRLLKMILTIFIAFVACYLPITTVKALGKEAEWPIASVISNLLIYLTTCINPLIYVAMSSEYRLAYKNLLTCRSDRECSTRSSSKNT